MGGRTKNRSCGLKLRSKGKEDNTQINVGNVLERWKLFLAEIMFSIKNHNRKYLRWKSTKMDWGKVNLGTRKVLLEILLEANNYCVKNVNCSVLLANFPLKINRKIWEFNVLTTVLTHNTIPVCMDAATLQRRGRTAWEDGRCFWMRWLEDYCLLACDALYHDINLSVFPRDVLPPSSTRRTFLLNVSEFPLHRSSSHPRTLHDCWRDEWPLFTVYVVRFSQRWNTGIRYFVMWLCVVVCVVPDVSKENINFIVKGKVYHEHSSFETSGVTQRRSVTFQKTGILMSLITCQAVRHWLPRTCREIDSDNSACNGISSTSICNDSHSVIKPAGLACLY
jgi:hypothetical protein